MRSYKEIRGEKIQATEKEINEKYPPVRAQRLIKLYRAVNCVQKARMKDAATERNQICFIAGGIISLIGTVFFMGTAILTAIFTMCFLFQDRLQQGTRRTLWHHMQHLRKIAGPVKQAREDFAEIISMDFVTSTVIDVVLPELFKNPASMPALQSA